MNDRVRHPRTVALFRVVLFLATAVAAVTLVVIAVSFLFVVMLFGTASLFVLGEPSGVAVAVIGGSGVLAVGFVGVLLVRTRRRIDQAVVDADRLPDPLDVVTARYVDGEIDEPELEREIESVLSTDEPVSANRRRPSRLPSSLGSRTDGETVALESPRRR